MLVNAGFVAQGTRQFDSLLTMHSMTQYPAVIVPFSTADPEKDPKRTEFSPLSETDAQVQALCEWCR